MKQMNCMVHDKSLSLHNFWHCHFSSLIAFLSSFEGGRDSSCFNLIMYSMVPGTMRIQQILRIQVEGIRIKKTSSRSKFSQHTIGHVVTGSFYFSKFCKLHFNRFSIHSDFTNQIRRKKRKPVFRYNFIFKRLFQS